jgi:hypothetical protein
VARSYMRRKAAPEFLAVTLAGGTPIRATF